MKLVVTKRDRVKPVVKQRDNEACSNKTRQSIWEGFPAGFRQATIRRPLDPGADVRGVAGKGCRQVAGTLPSGTHRVKPVVTKRDKVKPVVTKRDRVKPVVTKRDRVEACSNKTTQGEACSNKTRQSEAYSN